MEHQVLLKVEKMNKSFGITRAVVDMSLEFYRGEVHTIIGENGSGKSTLTSMIAGSYTPDSGNMTLKGERYAPANAIEGRKHGVCMLLQERGTIRNMSVAENIFLGRMNEVSKFGMINRKRMEREAATILKRICAEGISPSQSINAVSFEDAKLIEVGMALMTDPDILILDETTTALSQKGRDTVYQLIRELKDAGKCIILISHDFEEILSMSDRVTVMRDGNFIRTLKREEFDVNQMKSLLVGREFSEQYYRTDSIPDFEKEVILEVDGLSYKKEVKDVSFQLRRGEILGIGGLTDCGMHDLLKIIFGLLTPDSGTVYLSQKNVYIDCAHTAVQNGLGYLPKNREAEGLMMGGNIRENIVLMCYDKIKKAFLIGDQAEVKTTKDQIEALKIKAASLTQSVSNLSGGNKQKVVIAKCNANDVEIWLMDSPTRGIDIGVKAAIYRLLEKFKAEGKSMILVSEELQELIGMSDTLLILKDGEISHQFSRSADLTEAEVVKYMI